MEKVNLVKQKLAAERRLGPTARLLPTTTATTLRKDREPPLVIDGPFAETKEQLLGFYIVICASRDEALDIARELGKAAPGGSYEIRPVASFDGVLYRVAEIAWIDAGLTAARPKAVAALLR